MGEESNAPKPERKTLGRRIGFSGMILMAVILFLVVLDTCDSCSKQAEAVSSNQR